MIAKKDLVDLAVYSDGERTAFWDAEGDAFYFWRRKMGGYFLHCDPHPEDIEEDDWDCFRPLEKLNVNKETMRRLQWAQPPLP